MQINERDIERALGNRRSFYMSKGGNHVIYDKKRAMLG